MDGSGSIENRFQWSAYLLNSSLDSVFSDQIKVFLQGLEKEWATHFSKVSYELCQLEAGNRLRPIISFLGFLTSETDGQLHNDDYRKIIKVGVCIELIHKASLIIDDIIDGDSFRHGKTTFHVANGQEKAIAVSSQLIGKSFKLLMEVLQETNVPESTSLKCLNISINIINDMSEGLLQELTMINDDFSDIQVAKEIIQNEAASIIKNSLQIGYVLRGGDNELVVKYLGEIGESCGYIFQVMNDIEPYRNSTQYQHHKEKDKMEFFYDRKNIVTTFILQLMSTRQREAFYGSDNSVDKQQKLIEYFNKHKVYDHFMSEVAEIRKNITRSIALINGQGINNRWCLNCENFITSLTQVALSRLA